MIHGCGRTCEVLCARDVGGCVRRRAGGDWGIDGNVSVLLFNTLEEPKLFHGSLDAYKAALDGSNHNNGLSIHACLLAYTPTAYALALPFLKCTHF